MSRDRFAGQHSGLSKVNITGFLVLVLASVGLLYGCNATVLTLAISVTTDTLVA